MNAPKDWPALPVRVSFRVPGSSPCSPHFFVSSLPSIVPIACIVLFIRLLISTALPSLSASSAL